MTPEDILARVCSIATASMLVLDKPAGIAVHRGPKGGASLEDDFEHLRFGLPRKPALAHRLDRETSGCLVLGRHHKALEKLGKLFKAGRIGKTYWAVVEGGPAADEGLIDKPLGRRDPTRGWWMKVDPDGLPSQTRWRVLGRGALAGKPLTWLEMSPLTGRTHQLRVHAASEGWPILGDPFSRRGATARPCICTPAASRCRFRRTSPPWWRRRRRRSICGRRWRLAGSRGTRRGRRWWGRISQGRGACPSLDDRTTRHREPSEAIQTWGRADRSGEPHGGRARKARRSGAQSGSLRFARDDGEGVDRYRGKRPARDKFVFRLVVAL